MLSEWKKIQAVITAMAAAIAVRLGILALPVFLLLGLNITDYFTAIMAAPRRGEKVSSDRGMAGIKKKISMYILVCLGAVVDILLTVSTAGLTIPSRWVFALLVTIWLICNEVISILENLIDMGVAIPPFLLPLAECIRESIEGGGEAAGKCSLGQGRGQGGGNGAKDLPAGSNPEEEDK